MSTEYLFSGADVSGRDKLLVMTSPTTPPASAVTPIARSSTILALAVAVAFTCANTTALAHSADVSNLPVRVDLRQTVDHQIQTAISEREQPTADTRVATLELARQLRGANLGPDRAVADPDGGLALYIFAVGRFARIVRTNDNEIIVTCVDTAHDKQATWDATGALPNALRRLHAFLVG